MQFLPDVYVPCEVCHGKRYNRDAMEIKFKGKSIADVLEMTVDEALHFFEAIPSIKNKLQTLFDVGLGYIHLGSRRRRSPAAKPSGSSWPPSSPAGRPARRSTSWTSRRPACTSRMSRSCSRC